MPTRRVGMWSSLVMRKSTAAGPDSLGPPGSIQLRDLRVGYGDAMVLCDVELDIEPGEFAYLVGPSGAGKSTLLKVLYGTLRPKAGRVLVDGLAVDRLHSWQTGKIRRRVGCVFQEYELLPHLTALQNVLLPLQLGHPRLGKPREYALDALELVGLKDKLDVLPGNLSGGQQQRIAIARAIAHQPRILLADEPTGNVDSRTSGEIMELFGQLNEMGGTVVMATHDEFVLSRYPARTISLRPDYLRVARVDAARTSSAGSFAIRADCSAMAGAGRLEPTCEVVMKSVFALLVALLVVTLAASGAERATLAAESAPTQNPSSDLPQLNNQLSSDEAKLEKLNDQVERAQADLDRMSRRLAADKQREVELDQQLTRVARLSYQQPMLTLDSILEAQTIDQLFSNVAQAQLVALKEQGLLRQANELRRQDQQAHDQMAAAVSDIQGARDQARKVASRSLRLRDQAQDSAIRARAQVVAQQAMATPPASASGQPASGPNRFAYGYCTWYVANKRYIPWLGNAIEWWPNARAYGYAEGQTPQVGAIMVTRESGYGHVGYVEAVRSDGSWTVSEMNYVGWNVVSTRTIRPGQVPLVGFIYGKAG